MKRRTFIQSLAAICLAPLVLTGVKKKPVFRDANKAGFNSLQECYDCSTEPHIITDPNKGSLTIKRGSIDDTDNLCEIKNNAGDTVYVNPTMPDGYEQRLKEWINEH